MRPIATALAIAAAGLPAAASEAGARRESGAAAVPAGKPQSCIPINRIRESHVRSDRVIDFVMNDRRIYRTTLADACPQLGSERAFSYETSLSQLCSTDIITVIHQGGGPFTGASCGLSQFQPVTGVPR